MKNVFSEFVGTFILVFLGTGSIVMSEQMHWHIPGIGFACIFGIIVLCNIYALGRLIGVHVNPAVSIALSVAGWLPVRLLPAYITGQFLGALAGSYLLHYLFPANKFLGATVPAGTELQAFLTEVIISCILMAVIIIVVQAKPVLGRWWGTGIALAVVVIAIFAGPISGASMNPARSMGPAMASGHFEHLWLYFVAPVIGTTIASLVFRLVQFKAKLRQRSAPAITTNP